MVWGKGGVHAWSDTRDGSPRGNLELEVEGFDFAGRRPETAQAEAEERPSEMTEVEEEAPPF